MVLAKKIFFIQTMILLLVVGFVSFFTKAHAIDSSDLTESYFLQPTNILNIEDSKQHFGNTNEPYGKAVTKGVLVDASFGSIAGDGSVSEDGIDSGEELKDAFRNLDYYPLELYHPYVNNYYDSSTNFLDYGHSVLGNSRQPLLSNPPGKLLIEGNVGQDEIIQEILESLRFLEDNQYTSALQNTDLTNNYMKLFPRHQIFQRPTFPNTALFPLDIKHNIRKNIGQNAFGGIGGNRIPRVNDLFASGNTKNGNTLITKLGVAGAKHSSLGAPKESKFRVIEHGISGHSGSSRQSDGKRRGIPGNFGQSLSIGNNEAKRTAGNNFFGQRKMQGRSGNPWNYRNKGAPMNQNLHNFFQPNKLNKEFHSSYGATNLVRPQFFVKTKDSPNDNDLLFNQSFHKYENRGRDVQELDVFVRKSDFNNKVSFSSAGLNAGRLQEEGENTDEGAEVSLGDVNTDMEDRNKDRFLNQNLEEEKEEEGESESSEEE